MRRALAALCVMAAATAALASPPPLPAAVATHFPELRPYSDTRLRKLLWHVYDASLWVAGGRWSAEAPFALDIRYAMAIRARELTRVSVEEMRRLGHADAAVLARWEAAMDRLFPDIAPGDRLVGVHVPGGGARFYGERGLLGTVPDADFARAFFAIWLDEKSSEPDLRRRLLRLDE